MEKVLDLALALAVFAGLVLAGALIAGWLYDRMALDKTPLSHGAMARPRRRGPREPWSRFRRWWVGT